MDNFASLHLSARHVILHSGYLVSEAMRFPHRINLCLLSRCWCQLLTASVACCRNNVRTTEGGGSSVFLKVYSLTILLLDILSLVVKVTFAIIESIYHTVFGVAEQPVANEIVLVSDCPSLHNVSSIIRCESLMAEFVCASVSHVRNYRMDCD